MNFLFRVILPVMVFSCALQAFPQDRPPRDREQYFDGVEDKSEVKPGENIDEKIRQNFFLRSEVSKSTCYTGECIMATFKAYSRIDANSQVLKRPSLSGFSVIEMVDAYNNQPEIEKYNGSYFYVHLIRKVQLFPLQAGDFVIEPAEVESVIRLRSAEESRSGIRLRDLFRRNRRNSALQRQMVFRSPELTVHVKPLPEKDQPADFSGAVGNFTVQLVMDDTAVVQHEQASVKLKIRGTGNFPLITDPDIMWPAGVHVSEPTVAEEVNKFEFPLYGEKIFDFSLDNSMVGTFTIPPVSFSYFDPALSAYKTVQSLPVTYTVTADDGGKRSLPETFTQKKPETPLHLYYFGIVAAVIIGVIIFILVKSPGKKS